MRYCGSCIARHVRQGLLRLDLLGHLSTELTTHGSSAPASLIHFLFLLLHRSQAMTGREDGGAGVMIRGGRVGRAPSYRCEGDGSCIRVFEN